MVKNRRVPCINYLTYQQNKRIELSAPQKRSSVISSSLSPGPRVEPKPEATVSSTEDPAKPRVRCEKRPPSTHSAAGWQVFAAGCAEALSVFFFFFFRLQGKNDVVNLRNGPEAAPTLTQLNTASFGTVAASADARSA